VQPKDIVRLKYGEWWDRISEKASKKRHARNVRVCLDAVDYHNRENRPLDILLIHGSSRSSFKSSAKELSNSELLLRSAVALLAFDGDESIVLEASDSIDWIVSHLPVDLRTRFENTEQVRLIRRLQDTSASVTASRVIYPDGLSERELDVLRLIVEGRSSREIGDDLVLSVRTVERHIANIYLKTETHGRAQVTAYALQRGLG